MTTILVLILVLLDSFYVTYQTINGITAKTMAPSTFISLLILAIVCDIHIMSSLSKIGKNK